MKIKRLDTSNRMSQAVVHGDIVYLAGQVAQEAPGAKIEAQTSAVLEQIDLLLQKAGSDKDKILSATIWLTSMDDFESMNSIWDQWVTSGSAPCRACIESPRLASANYNVEISVIAAI